MTQRDSTEQTLSQDGSRERGDFGKDFGNSVSDNYGAGKQTLYSYSTLMGVFNLIFALFLLLARKLQSPIPDRLEGKDIALLGMATHKLSLVGTEDAITSPLRAPFSELQEKESPKSVDEKPRGEGLQEVCGRAFDMQVLSRHVGGLLFTYGLVLAPRVTRLVAGVFAILTISDYLHQTYKLLMNRA